MSHGGDSLSRFVAPFALALVTTTAASCAEKRPPPVAPAPAAPAKRLHLHGAPEDWFWEPAEADSEDAAERAADLPTTETKVVRIEGAARAWIELGDENRDRLLRDGVLVTERTPEMPASVGAFYTYWRDRRVPYVVTYEALSFVVHRALEAALAEAEQSVLVPSLHELLVALDAGLLREQSTAGAELAPAASSARAVVDVALALWDGPDAPRASEVARAISEEVVRIDEHRGPAESPLLGVPIDYSRFAVPSGAAAPPAEKALAWLSLAPLSLVAKSEADGALVGVATARSNARAGMLLARLVDRDVDPRLHAVWSRVVRLHRFVWGRADDVGPAELADIAASLGVDVENPAHVTDVVRVDRVRRRASSTRAPALWDGSGAASRAGTSVRLFGAHASAESMLLASLVTPNAGGAVLGAPVRNTRDGLRVLPSTLDIAVWAGLPSARDALHESSADSFEGFDAAIDDKIQKRTAWSDASWHASLYGSLLVAAWQSSTPKGLTSPALERLAIETALSSWTFARHLGAPLARSVQVTPLATELEVSGGPLAAFVAPPSFALAHLLAALRQGRRGFAALGGLAPGSGADRLLVEAEDLVQGVLRVSQRRARGEALTSQDKAVLASMPARLARFEAASGNEDGAVAMVADVHADPRGGRNLVTATGLFEPAFFLVRDEAGRLVFAVGAHVPHYEVVDPLAQPTTDASLRARLRAGDAPSRGAYVASFRRVESAP